MKFDVYEYKTHGGVSHLFSKGVTREFGENKIVSFLDGLQALVSVQPLKYHNGLAVVGTIWVDKQK